MMLPPSVLTSFFLTTRHFCPMIQGTFDLGM